MRHWFCRFLWVFLVNPAWAATEIKGSINWVSDGDTVWLRPDPGQDLGKVRLHKGRVKLRLAAIDAPESCQDWGAEAAAALRIQLKNQPVRAQLYVQSDKLAKQALFEVDPSLSSVSAMVLIDQLGKQKQTRIRYLARKERTVPVEWLNPMFLARSPVLE